jgi:hypothetical protein
LNYDLVEITTMNAADTIANGITACITFNDYIAHIEQYFSTIDSFRDAHIYASQIASIPSICPDHSECHRNAIYYVLSLISYTYTDRYGGEPFKERVQNPCNVCQFDFRGIIEHIFDVLQTVPIEFRPEMLYNMAILAETKEECAEYFNMYIEYTYELIDYVRIIEICKFFHSASHKLTKDNIEKLREHWYASGTRKLPIGIN